MSLSSLLRWKKAVVKVGVSSYTFIYRRQGVHRGDRDWCACGQAAQEARKESISREGASRVITQGELDKCTWRLGIKTPCSPDTVFITVFTRAPSL